MGEGWEGQDEKIIEVVVDGRRLTGKRHKEVL